MKRILRFFKFSKSKDKGKRKDEEPERSNASRMITLEDILRQTLNWDRRCFLGTGRTGNVYRPAAYHDYEIVAFKRVLQQPLNREFKSETFFLREMHHENIVRLRGVCTENNEKIVILEHIPNGTLHDRLQGTRKKVLGWETRMRVALGTARAINNIHLAVPYAVIHRDIKSTHILLDEMDNAKLIDFGHAVFEFKRTPSDNDAGTEPYIAPECKRDNLFTKCSDIYSFGVVLLEIISGRKPIQDRVPITEWANRKLSTGNFDDRVLRMVDKKIRKTVPPDDLRKIVKLATDCIHPLFLHRPLIAQVVSRLLQISCLTHSAASTSGTAAGRLLSPSSSPLVTIIE